MTTQQEVRKDFWEYIKTVNPEMYKLKRTNKKHNDYPAEVRTVFSYYIDLLCKDKVISGKLANKVIL